MESETEKTQLTAEIVAAYVRNNVVQPAELPNLISVVRETLEGLGAKPAPEPAEKSPWPCAEAMLLEVLLAW